MTVSDVNLVPVVDYARLKRIAPKQTGTPRTPMTTACMVMCTIGFIFIVKRYRDKRASGQSRTRDTLRA
jgi:hypothetical protein